MPPENIGGGQFGQATGGQDALRAALQRRGLDESVLNQVSASAPQGPSPTPPAVQGQPQESLGLTQQVAAQEAGGQEVQVPFRSAEGEIALKALADVAKGENRLAQQALRLQQPQGLFR